MALILTQKIRKYLKQRNNEICMSYIKYYNRFYEYYKIN